MLMRRGVSTATLDGTWTTTELLSSFDVDHIATEALLFQTGYLTITGTQQQDIDTLYKLDYPNLECVAVSTKPCCGNSWVLKRSKPLP